MAKFQVRVMDRATQKISTDEVEAADRDELGSILTARGVVLLDATSRRKWSEVQIGGAKKVQARDMALLVRELATVVDAGVPIMQALSDRATEETHPTLKPVLESVSGDVASGMSLADAMNRHPQVFPPVLVTSVRAGESGGNMDAALLQSADILEKDASLAAEVRSMMAYPAVISIIGLVGFIVMITFAVPTMAEIYDDLDGELPQLTQTLLWISDQMQIIGPVLLVAMVLFGMWWARNKNKPGVRKVVDPGKLSAPIFGGLFLKVAVARSLRTLSGLLGSGVPMVAAIREAAPTSNNTKIAGILEAAADQVELGQQFSDHVGAGGVFPPLVRRMSAAGEKAAALPETLAKLCDLYDSDIERAARMLSALIQPLLIVVIGAGVGLVAAGMMLPMVQVYDLL